MVLINKITLIALLVISPVVAFTQKSLPFPLGTTLIIDNATVNVLGNDYSITSYGNKGISTEVKLESKVNEVTITNFILLLDQLESAFNIKYDYLGETYPSNYEYRAYKDGIEYKIRLLKANLTTNNIYKVKITIQFNPLINK